MTLYVLAEQTVEKNGELTSLARLRQGSTSHERVHRALAACVRARERASDVPPVDFSRSS